MIWATVLADTLHATLKHREKAVNGVGVDVVVNTRNILAGAMSYILVIAEVVAQFVVLNRLISQHASGTLNVGLKDRQQGSRLEVVNSHAARFADVAVNQRKHFVLVMLATSLSFSLAALLAVIADKSLVNFNGSTVRTEHGQPVIAHRFADTVRHEPS